MAEAVCDQVELYPNAWMHPQALAIRATFAEVVVLSLVRPERAVVLKAQALMLANDLGFGQDKDCPCPILLADEPQLVEAFRRGIQQGIDYFLEQTRWARAQQAMHEWRTD